MSNSPSRLELTSDETSLVEASAAMFGFSPVRPEWFRHQFDVNREQMRSTPRDPRASMEMPIGWWSGWPNIGEVTEDEAREMADAIDRAREWYSSHPGEVPDWFRPYPDWNWKGIARVIRTPHLLDSLAKTVAFLRGGAFTGTVRHNPYVIILER